MLDEERLRSYIVEETEKLTDEQKREPIEAWLAVSKAIIKEIQENAKIKIGTLSTTGSGNLGAPVSSSNTNEGVIE